MPVDHELTFCSDAAGWMNQELEARPELAFGGVKIEQSTRGSRQRRDLSIYDRSGKIAITGEVKLPYMPDGGSPYNDSVVDDAFNKAARAGARFFVTWNVNRLVLWRTDDEGKPLFERHIYDDAFVQVRDPADLVNPSVQQVIRRGLIRFLERASDAFTGRLPLAKRPLDEFFITVLEAALERPIATIQAAISRRYVQGGHFRLKMDSWMRDTQGWQLSDDELVQRDNLERAAKFACYVLVNKVVFYKALRKRFTSLPNIRVPGRMESAGQLHVAMNGFFLRAMKATRDYETVFEGDFGDTLPFLTDNAVPAWRELLESIDRFDFTQINYDVIGPIFERLISPEERHRYGQHYTKAEIVDLIEAFCIRKPDAVVIDPACGGGTFLVRAYNRKKNLAQREGGELTHEELLNQLYGIDISAYATHLTTMNLATRDLIDEQNYPLVAQSDFFDVEPGRAILHVPLARGSRERQLRPILIQSADAVVGNPPYVRQEEISKPPTASAKGKGKVAARSLTQIKIEATKYKQRLMELARRAWPDIQLSGRSDLHVYFWPHATTLLKPDGHYGFLTSSGWLDVEYGFRLQEFLLHHYAILAIFESQVEPWFTGARVTTCATILRRETNARRRDENLVRFVQLRSPLSTIFPSNATEEQRQRAAEALRDRIEETRSNRSDPHWRVRVVKQSELYQLGSKIAGHTAEREEEGEEALPNGGGTNTRTYFGSKWGVYLRAPDLYFELLDRFGQRMVPLGEIAEVRFGVKTGCDKFFFVRDVTERCLADTPNPREFRAKYGVQPFQTDKLRVVQSGDQSLHLLEARFLEPEIHSLMEISRPVINELELDRRIFLCNLSKAQLRGTYAYKYIGYGEREDYHKTVTVEARSEQKNWYDLTDGIRPQIILPKIQQYRHIVPLNPSERMCNSSLLAIRTKQNPFVLAGILNSTLIGLFKWFYGRQLGNEANLQIDVYAAKSLLVPDLRSIEDKVKHRIESAMRQLAQRPSGDLDEEIERNDRIELDDAVLEALGENSAQERQAILNSLYRETTSFYKAMKEKELLAMKNRAATARGSRLSAAQIADEVWKSLDPSLVRRLPEDFIAPRERVETINLTDGKCRVLSSPLLGRAGLQIDQTHIELGDEQRAQLAKVICDAGRRGPVPIPLDPHVCAQIVEQYQQYHDQVSAEFVHLVAQKTADDKMQAKVITILQHKLVNGRVEANIEPG